LLTDWIVSRRPTVLLSGSQTGYGAAIASRNEAITEFFDVVKLGANIGARRQEFVSEYYETDHPVVRVHPETGKRVLLRRPLCQTLRRVGPGRVGDLVQPVAGTDHRAGNQYSLELAGRRSGDLAIWRSGDLAIWDNRTTTHYAVADCDDQYRRLSPIPLAS
jgi:taurine dioxygenase